jgi:hypothetical protein
MITKMKKLTFLVYHKEYEAFLAQIRELGVVHVVERQCGEMDDTLQQFMQKRTLYKNMLQSMHTLADKQPEEKVHKELSADALVKFYEDLQARIQDLNQQIPGIDKDVAQMEVWGDFDWRVIAYGEQANLYAELGMYDQALEMNKKAQYYSMLKDSFGLGDLYRYRAQIFRNMNQKDSVFHYLRLGEKLSMIQNSFKGVFVNKVETVNSYLDYPDSLEKALQLALSICPDTVRMPQWAKYQLNLHLGRALLQTGKEQNGIHLIDRAAQDLINMKFMEGRDANEILMDYYLAKGMNDDFARCYIRNRQFADSLDNNEKKRAVAAANIRFDANQKEKENKLLSAQVQWQQQQLFYNICISITLLLLLITTTAYFIIRRKANHQLIENNKREIQTLITRQQDLNRRNEQLTEEIERAMATNNLNSIRQLTVQSLLSREDENTFRRSFATIHPSYLPKLRESYPQLTRNEELLAMLICMNQSTDEIALIMGINRNSVNVVRSRMRKNMELPKEKSLDEVLKQYLT